MSQPTDMMIAGVQVLPDSGMLIEDMIGDVDQLRYSLKWSWPSLLQVYNFGDTIYCTVDHLEIASERTGPEPTYLEAFLLTGSQIPCITLTSLSASISCCTGITGNVDGDGSDLIKVTDLTYLIAYLFRGGEPPPCMEEADVNADGDVKITDLTYLIAYLFRGGPEPAPCL